MAPGGVSVLGQCSTCRVEKRLLSEQRRLGLAGSPLRPQSDCSYQWPLALQPGSSRNVAVNGKRFRPYVLGNYHAESGVSNNVGIRRLAVFRISFKPKACILVLAVHFCLIVASGSG